MTQQLPLDKIRDTIMRQVATIHDNDYAREEIFEILDCNLDSHEKLVNLRVHVMITQNTLNFRIYEVNIIIERYRCQVNGVKGNVTMSIPILNVTDLCVHPKTIGIEFSTKELWDASSLEEIQNHIAETWNKGLAPKQ